MTDTLNSNILKIAVEVDRAFGATNDNLPLKVISRSRPEVEQSGSQASEFCVWQLAPVAQFGPQLAYNIGGLESDLASAPVGMTVDAQKEVAGVVACWVGSDILPQVGQDFYRQGANPSDLSRLPSSVVHDTGVEVNALSRKVGDVGVCEPGADPKSDPAFHGEVGRKVQFGDVLWLDALNEPDSFIPNILFAGTLELWAWTPAVDVLHFSGPAVQDANATDDAIETSAGPLAEPSGVLGEDFGSIGVAEQGTTPDELTELVQLAVVIAERPFRQLAGLAGLDAQLASFHEQGHYIAVGPVADSDGRRFSVYLFLLCDPAVFNLIERYIFGADESRLSFVPADPSIAVRGAAWRPLGLVRCPALHCGETLWKALAEIASITESTAYSVLVGPTLAGIYFAPNRIAFLAQVTFTHTTYVKPASQDNSADQPNFWLNTAGWSCGRIVELRLNVNSANGVLLSAGAGSGIEGGSNPVGAGTGSVEVEQGGGLPHLLVNQGQHIKQGEKQ